MPYSSAYDPTLPKDIKKLSAKRRRIFIAVFNSVYKETKDEGRAFAAARSKAKGK